MSAVTDATYPARWWRELPDGRLECRLCPRYCKLGVGQRGFCFVRRNDGGKMVLTTYGRSSGFCIDPIEKKPLNHFLPGSAVMSFGTAGCNLGCKFCQNWDISKARDMDRLMDEAPPETIARAAEEHACRAVAFTYNDPVIFAEYAIDTARACRELGLATVAVTAGYITAEARPEFFAAMDAANVDLKAFSDEFYRKVTLSRLGEVLDTLVYLKHETSTWFEITTLLIPGENDSDAELDAATDWVAENLGPDVPWHFTAFHPDFKMLDKHRTPRETLRRARDIAMGKGLRYIYVGNVLDGVGASTWCPACGELLIERTGYTLGRWGLDESGCCQQCGTRIPGRFEPAPGRWGSRRQPLRLGQ